MSIYKKEIEKTINEIEKLISELEVLNEQKDYIEILRNKSRMLDRIIVSAEKTI